VRASLEKLRLDFQGGHVCSVINERDDYLMPPGEGCRLVETQFQDRQRMAICVCLPKASATVFMNNRFHRFTCQSKDAAAMPREVTSCKSMMSIMGQ
jgi:hypothetical protein